MNKIYLLGLVYISVFVLFIWFFYLIKKLKLYIKSRNATNWVIIEGIITKIEVNQNIRFLNEVEELEDKFKVVYEYQYFGEHFFGSKITVDKEYISDKSTDKKIKFVKSNVDVLTKLKKNPRVQIWLNPQKPTEAILHNEPYTFLMPLIFNAIFYMILMLLSYVYFLGANSESTFKTSIKILEMKSPLEILH